MHTLRDAFSLILGAKSRAFRTDFYQVTGNKVMMNWSVDCFHLLLIFSERKPRMIIKFISKRFQDSTFVSIFPVSNLKN